MLSNSIRPETSLLLVHLRALSLTPTQAAVPTLTSAGSSDVFVWKLTGDGQYVAAKRMGGAGYDNAGVAEGLTVDLDGSVYITGRFLSLADFDSTVLRSRGATDAYVAAMDSNLNVKWCAQFGGGYGEMAYVSDIVNFSTV